MAGGCAVTTEKLTGEETDSGGPGFATVMVLLPAVATSLAVIAAVSRELDTKVVLRFEPFHCTTAFESKFTPETVSENPACPATALEGLREVISGTDVEMVKVSAFEVPPPGEGLKTVICTVPGLVMSPLEMLAVNCELLTKVVVRPAPFHWIVEPEMKLDPFTVKVKAAPPAGVLVGESELMLGTGLFWVV